jgi:cytosine/adenosine deaminase-related metal-dependent hydrolase
MGRAGTSRAGRGSTDEDPFTRAYLAGTPEQVPEPRPRKGGGRGAPAGPVALRGCVLGPDGPQESSWLVLADGAVKEIRKNKPTGVTTLDTGGVILPGLIDLHGHPEFNVFAAWEPPRLYRNRYSWRGSDVYHALVRDPQNKLIAALPAQTQLRYAEVRALAGGVTAIQGASGTNRATDESLVRNVDLRIFGDHKARAMIDLPSKTSRDVQRLADIVAAIGTGDVTAFYLHLAEGARDDPRSQKEFDTLVGFSALTKGTVLIHATALTKAQLGQVADAGAKLVWSPQSNLRLYGETTRAADALAVGVPVALGADWLPSGSTSLLAELQVARAELSAQGLEAKPRDLVAMVTSVAAKVAGLDQRIGTLKPGFAADVLVLERRHDDPYESVCRSLPLDVRLVTIGGDIAYGRSDWVQTLVADPSSVRLEPVIAWGRRMLLDTTFHAGPAAGTPAPTLASVRAALTATYPPVGPVWA